MKRFKSSYVLNLPPQQARIFRCLLSFNTAGTNTFRPTAAPSLQLVVGMAMAFMPRRLQCREDTVIVEGATTAYRRKTVKATGIGSVKTTRSGHQNADDSARYPAVGQYYQPTAYGRPAVANLGREVF